MSAPDDDLHDMRPATIHAFDPDPNQDFEDQEPLTIGALEPNIDTTDLDEAVPAGEITGEPVPAADPDLDLEAAIADNAAANDPDQGPQQGMGYG